MRAWMWGGALLLLSSCRTQAEPHFEEPSGTDTSPTARDPEREPIADDAPKKTSSVTGQVTPTPVGQGAQDTENASKEGAPPPALTPRPTSPDPEKGEFSLQEALAGLEGEGALTATIDTSMGAITCGLYEEKAPNTVANFVGLARGKRPFWDAREGAWVSRPLYDGSSFHRVIPGFMIQGGDYLGTGRGEVGYTIADELHPSLKHDRAGLLCMANRGPDTNGGQFFITDAATPHLTRMKSYTIFGECTPTSLISKIAAVPKSPTSAERPAEPVTIRSVKVQRVAKK